MSFIDKLSKMVASPQRWEVAKRIKRKQFITDGEDVIEIEARFHSLAGQPGCGVPIEIFDAVRQRLANEHIVPTKSFLRTISSGETRIRNGRSFTKQKMFTVKHQNSTAGWTLNVVTSLERPVQPVDPATFGNAIDRYIWRESYVIAKMETGQEVKLDLSAIIRDSRQSNMPVILKFEMEVEVELSSLFHHLVEEAERVVTAAAFVCGAFFRPVFFGKQRNVTTKALLRNVVTLLKRRRTTKRLFPPLRNTDGFRIQSLGDYVWTEKTDGIPIFLLYNEKNELWISTDVGATNPVVWRWDLPFTPMKEGITFPVIFAGELIAHRLIVFVFDVVFARMSKFTDFQSKAAFMSNAFTVDIRSGDNDDFPSLQIVSKRFAPLESNVIEHLSRRESPGLIPDNLADHLSDGLVLQPNNRYVGQDALFPIKLKLPSEQSVDLEVELRRDNLDLGILSEHPTEHARLFASNNDDALTLVDIPAWYQYFGVLLRPDCFNKTQGGVGVTNANRIVIEFVFDNTTSDMLRISRIRHDKSSGNALLTVVSTLYITLNPQQDDIRSIGLRPSTRDIAERENISLHALYEKLAREFYASIESKNDETPEDDAFLAQQQIDADRNDVYDPLDPLVGYDYDPDAAPYNPQSPPYRPESPEYQPASPSYKPSSPQYAPLSPNYQPPNETAGAPDSPSYLPVSDAVIAELEQKTSQDNPPSPKRRRIGRPGHPVSDRIESALEDILDLFPSNDSPVVLNDDDEEVIAIKPPVVQNRYNAQLEQYVDLSAFIKPLKIRTIARKKALQAILA